MVVASAFRHTAHAAALCLWLAGAAAAAWAETPQWRAWAEEAHGRHPLAGRLYAVASGKLAGGPGLVLPDGIVALGEVHDNPAHHRLRAWLIAETLRARPGWRPAVVFEQISDDQQGALDRYWTGPRHGMLSAADLLRDLQWDKSGWPAAEIYTPLFDAVVSHFLPIYAGNAPKDRVRAVARGGLAVLTPEERARLRLDLALPASLGTALDRELAESHCGALPPQAIPGMAAAQRYRDAHLADALLRAEKDHGSAILIAGNGHVRSDRGVPWHVRQREAGAKVVSVLLLEVEEGNADPAAYVPRDPEGRPAADLVIFTPRAQRADPCEGFMKGRK